MLALTCICIGLTRRRSATVSQPSAPEVGVGGGTRDRSSLPVRAGRVVARITLVLVIAGVVTVVGAAWLGHWRLVVIESISMEPSIPRSSLAAVRPVNPKAVAVGEVLMFRNPSDRRHLITHRVIGRLEQGASVFYETQGDANSTPDPFVVPSGDVRGVVEGHVPRVGALARHADEPAAAAVLVGLPLLGVLRGEMRRRSRATSSL